MNHKLASIVIPNVEFRQTTLSDAVEYLRQESSRLDADPNPQTRGVNLILRLPPPVQAAAAVPDAAAGLPAGADKAPGAMAGSSPATNVRITLTLSHIPLSEALKYVASQAGLKVRIEPYAVCLVSPLEEIDTLINATFRVPPGFIGNSPSGGGKSALDQGAASPP